MPENLPNARSLRPADLARRHGLSTQAVRNYEAAGILPAANRTDSGYRVYTPRHAAALDAFVALVPAFGHQTATAILQAVHSGAIDQALQLIDRSHEQALRDRRTLHAVEAALEDLPPLRDDAVATAIGPLAHRLGIHPATLRTWERSGLVRPDRNRRTGYRIYSAADVRDAELTHLLRRGGYPLERIAPVLERVRAAGGIGPLAEMIGDWHDRLTARGRAMLRGAAALDGYLAGPGSS